MRSWKPAEDCPGYGSITWYDAMSYMLETDTYEPFRQSGNLRKLADYAMLITNNLGYVSGFGDISSFSDGAHVPGLLLLAGWLERDGRYLWFYDKMPPVAPRSDEYFGNHYLVDGIERGRPDDLLGVKAFELPDWVYEHRADVLQAASAGVTAVLDTQPVPPYEKCFDKISFRAGFDPADDYLLLGGLSHGYHAHPDGNAIVGYTANGKYWLFDNGYFVPDTIEHNTVCVFREGLLEPIPRLTSLEGKADFATVGMTQTQCRGYGGVDWRRNILWQKGRYFAVLDELEALADGDFNFQCIWRTMGDIDLEADRMLVSQGAARFCLIKAGGGLMKLADVTPQAADRRALVETCPATLKAGERAGILNVFYSPRGGEYPYDAARLTETGLLVAEPDRHVLVAAGDFERGDVRCRAKLAALSAAEFSLLDATELDWGGPALRSDAPLSLQLDRRTGAGDVEVTQACRAGFRVGDGALKLDGKAAGEERDGLVWVELSPGNHNLQVGADVAGPSEAQVAEWFSAAAAQRVAAGAQATPASPQLKALWTADNPVVTRKDIFRAEGTAAEEVTDLAQSGTARYWEKGSEGSSPAAATDGDPETYCAVTSRAPNVNDVPKDLGIEWAEPVTVGEVWVQHYNVGYRPAEEGQDLQCWDGAKWVSIDDTITGAETAEWVHTFTPVQTTRIRLLVTKFNTMRTAIREMRVFSRPVEAAQVEVTRQRPAKALAAADVNGDGRDEVAAAVEGTVVLYDADGAVQWERDLGSPVQALTAGTLDGPALVASTADRRLHRIAPDGTVVWSVDSPKDKYFPEIEPAPGVFTVLAVGDIDADGDGEIVAGNSNWFAYGFDHLGAKLWGTLNWAHPALSIALGDVRGDGKLAALIGTRYNDANLFQWDGKQIASLGMGYHSCPCATALADLDGNGVMEMIGGSRIGGLQAGKLDGTRLWAYDMGAEVREVLAADLTGDGKVEVLAGSRNCYVLCLDAAGKVLWRRNLLDAIVSMLTADVNGDGRPEIVVGVEDGTLHVLDAGGAELNAFRTDGSITDVAIAGRGEGALAIIAGSADGKVYALGQ